MKSFSLFFISLFSTLSFGQGQFYGTFNLNYTHSSININDSGQNFSETLDKSIWRPSMNIGFGYIFPNDKKLKPKLLFDIGSFLGEANYQWTYSGYNRFNGKLYYKGINIHLKPMLNYQFNQKMSCDLGLNLGYAFFRTRKIGTSTNLGFVEDARIVWYSTPQYEDINEKDYYISTLPSCGLITNFNYQISSKFEIIVSYSFDRYYEFMNTSSVFFHNYSLGVNYFFKSKKG